jgi:GDPmannose 4,6-dehydratase
MKKALITSVTAEDGSCLAKLLFAKGHEIHGMKRRALSINIGRIDHIYKHQNIQDNRFFLHNGDLADTSSTRLTWMRLIRRHKLLVSHGYDVAISSE